METKKKKVKAIISRSKTGYVIMMEGFDWAMSYGDTLEEAKKDFENFPSEYIAVSKEFGKEVPPELNDGNLEFEYVFDLSSFFSYYNFISPTKLARKMKINTSLMRQYAMGKTYISRKKKMLIEKEIHSIGRELMAVTL
ncbi:MAG: pilus assembly protein HicB [Bacteroidales bacterium]|jgi:predicted RNase H-like HicB family nuclease|nr:pilus assembly protein HicB [Bacteroidales bacterium]